MYGHDLRGMGLGYALGIWCAWDGGKYGVRYDIQNGLSIDSDL